MTDKEHTYIVGRYYYSNNKRGIACVRYNSLASVDLLPPTLTELLYIRATTKRKAIKAFLEEVRSIA